MINVAVICSNNYEQAESAVRDRYAEKFFFLRRGSIADENDLTVYCKQLNSYCS
jgi:hypothetical protein